MPPAPARDNRRTPSSSSSPALLSPVARSRQDSRAVYPAMASALVRAASDMDSSDAGKAMRQVCMDENHELCRSHLFTVRLWQERLGGGRVEWRGQVRHVTSGETSYFRDWPTLVSLLLEMLSRQEDEAEQPASQP